jgi:predicted oxidoreductase (fatty acid repression mutant protein)
MLNSAKRRVSILERSIELPITADRFLASVQERARLTGASFNDAFRSLLVLLSDENLEHLEKDLKQRFGDLAPDNVADKTVEESGGNAVADKLVFDNG